MKCSSGTSDFLEEIPSLSQSVVFLYFFALIAEEGFLISSCYSLELLGAVGELVRNRTLGPPLENSPEIPPSSREEGLRLLHGLATNLATSLQTPQEA